MRLPEIGSAVYCTIQTNDISLSPAITPELWKLVCLEECIFMILLSIRAIGCIAGVVRAVAGTGADTAGAGTLRRTAAITWAAGLSVAVAGVVASSDQAICGSCYSH